MIRKEEKPNTMRLTEENPEKLFIENVPSISSDVDLTDSKTRSCPSPKKTGRYKLQFYRDENHERKNNGIRKNRRSENLNYLLSLVNDEELDFSLSHITEPCTTAFQELFLEDGKMQAWNDFINQSEEDQQCLLQGNINTTSTSSAICRQSDKAENETMEKETFEMVDKRDIHPAFSAKECFKRIDSRLQRFLRQQRLPWGMLTGLEDEVTSFFQSFPNSVLVSSLSSSYERILMHAVCQYLQLSSYSFDDDSGIRRTQVENSQQHFCPPDVTMVNYLKESHH